MEKHIDDEIFKFLSLDGKEEKFTSDNIVLLLGAGASMDAGVETLNGIMRTVEEGLTKKVEKMIERYNPNTHKGYDIEVIQLNREKRKLALFNYLKRKCVSINYSMNDSANIEEVLALIKDVVALKDNSHLYNVIGEWEKELIEASRDNFELLNELRRDIEKAITDSLKLKSKKTPKLKGLKLDEELYSRLKYFNFIFYLHRKAGGTLNIFTLNHDLTLEEAYRLYCQEELLKRPGKTLLEVYKERVKNGDFKIKEPLDLPFPIETGFDDKLYIENNRLRYNHQIESKKAVFNPDHLLKDIENDTRIKVYKLHGSLNWHRDSARNKILPFLPKGETKGLHKGDETEMIFGVSQKYKSEEPYSTLYHEFKNRLKVQKVKLLVVVGYAFNDVHINNAISSAMEANKELKIVITDPNVSETYFFSQPVFLSKFETEKLYNKKDENGSGLLANIITTRHYEEYMNAIDALYPAFYCRNYDEDALFLSFCNYQRIQRELCKKINKEKIAFEDHECYIHHTKAGIKDGEPWLKALFENNIQEVATLFNLKEIAQDFSKEPKRNEKIYNRLFNDDPKDKKAVAGSKKYNAKIKQITNLKSILYSNWKRVRSNRPIINDGKEDPAPKNKKENPITARKRQKERYQELEKYERCFLELREDLNVIEVFLRKVIPVHTYLIFFYIEEYNRALKNYEEAYVQLEAKAKEKEKSDHQLTKKKKLTGDDKKKAEELKQDIEKKKKDTTSKLQPIKTLSLTIVELFLKYYYFTDVIKVKMVDNNTSKEQLEQLLGKDYVDNFTDMLNLNVIDKDYSLRSKEVENRMIGRKYSKVLIEINNFLDELRDAIVSKTGKANNYKFGPDFFTLEMQIDKRLVNHTVPFLENNFLAKNVLHKKETDEKRMNMQVELYTKAVCKSLISRLNYKDRLLTDIKQLIKVSQVKDDTFKEQLKKGNLSRQGLSLQTNVGNYFADDGYLSLNMDQKTEVANRIRFNIDSYTHKEYKNLINNLNSTYTLCFDKYLENMRFMHKLWFPAKNKYENDFKKKEEEWEKYYVKRMELLESDFDRAAKMEAEKDAFFDYLKDKDRVIFRHFKAKLFFSKEFRILNMFKYYNSTFDIKTHLQSFNNVNGLIGGDFIEDTGGNA